MPVHRTRPLPQGPNRGRLIVPNAVAAQTRVTLQGFCGPDGRHEGMLFWLGRRLSCDTIVVGAAVPACHHGPQRVMAPAAAVGRIARKARDFGLGIVAQVHSHPGKDTRHSDGDDSLILMPFEGMFSLIVGLYGDSGITTEMGLGVHQFQDKRWVQIPAAHAAVLVVPRLVGGLV